MTQPSWFRAAILALALATRPAAAQTLSIRFVDVGQGDAALVVTPEGKRILIDAGRDDGRLVSFLRAHRVDTLDLVIASHNHADHIGGMAGVLRGTVVRFYLDNGVPHTTATYTRTIAALEGSGAQYLRATKRTITVGSVRVRILAPAGQGDQNNSSVGAVIEFGELRALFTGDSEQPELAHWLSQDSVPRVQVLKVAHHGSGNGTSEAWVARTRPQVAVLSVGARNQYGHPSPRVVALWANAGARVYRTDVHGTVEIAASSDGSFTVSSGTGIPAVDSSAVGIRANTRDSSDTAAARSCCRICSRGQACGNTCISRAYVCRTPPGCACNARP